MMDYENFNTIEVSKLTGIIRVNIGGAGGYDYDVIMQAIGCFGHLIAGMGRVGFQDLADEIEIHYDTNNPAIAETVRVLRKHPFKCILFVQNFNNIEEVEDED